jgi:hypothetical protein
MSVQALGTVAALGLIAACASLPDRAPSMTVAGTELVLTVGTRELRSADLVGASLAIGTRTVRLDGVDRDPQAPDVLRHRFMVVAPDGQAVPLCTADAEGGRWAIPLVDDRREIQLVCSSGAIAKCIRWGYPPWQRDGAGPARALHDACVRMVRADYGGTGATATRDGTRIEFCDRAGIRACPDDEQRFEAAWSPGGAVCIARPRIPALGTLDELAVRYPHLAGHLGRACTVAGVGDRAVLFSFVPEAR